MRLFCFSPQLQFPRRWSLVCRMHPLSERVCFPVKCPEESEQCDLFFSFRSRAAHNRSGFSFGCVYGTLQFQAVAECPLVFFVACGSLCKVVRSARHADAGAEAQHADNAQSDAMLYDINGAVISDVIVTLRPENELNFFSYPGSVLLSASCRR